MSPTLGHDPPPDIIGAILVWLGNWMYASPFLLAVVVMLAEYGRRAKNRAWWRHVIRYSKNWRDT